MRSSPSIESLDFSPKPWLNQDLTAKDIAGLLDSKEIREYWKYTSMSSLLETHLNSVNSAKKENQTIIKMEGIEGIKVESFLDLSQSKLDVVRNAISKIDKNRYLLSYLMAMSNPTGRLITINKNINQIVEITPSETQEILIIDIEKGTNVSIKENTPFRPFANRIIGINIRDEAKLTHARSSFFNTPTDLSLVNIEVQKNAEYHLEQYATGSEKRRSNIHIALTGNRAKTSVIGAYITEENRHIDQQVVIDHQEQNTQSTQQVNGIGHKKSKSSFLGRIHISKNAKHSDATLNNKNLALGKNATINTKPELEIYTDDVKCSHGATVGQLDEEQIFYLRSRSLSQSDAKTLLCNAFIKSCIRGNLTQLATEKFTQCLK